MLIDIYGSVVLSMRIYILFYLCSTVENHEATKYNSQITVNFEHLGVCFRLQIVVSDILALIF